VCVEALRAKVAKGGRVVSAEDTERMIDDAVDRVTKSCYDSAEDVDATIKSHVGAVTQQFVDRLVEQIFADMNAPEQHDHY